MELADFFKHVQERVNYCMQQKLERLPVEPRELKDAMQYALLLGGKRARPFLVYATGLAFGGNERNLDYAAAAVESIHAFSLVHDDMPEMDNDFLRRGQPSVHAKFGSATALLAGDALQAFAFDCITDIKCKLSGVTKAHLCACLAQATGFAGMCGGQSLDLAAEHKQLNRPDLEHLHSLKTGALITASVQMGYLAATDDMRQADTYVDPIANAMNLVEAWPMNRELESLKAYGRKVGLAFQVWDDVLDVEGDTAVLGKPAGSDEKLEKSTYVTLMGLEQAKVYARQLSAEAKDCLSNLDVDTRLLMQFADFSVQRDH